MLISTSLNIKRVLPAFSQSNARQPPGLYPKPLCILAAHPGNRLRRSNVNRLIRIKNTTPSICTLDGAEATTGRPDGGNGKGIICLIMSVYFD